MPRERKTDPDEPPVLASAKRAIRRTLRHLTPVQLLRLAATAEALAYGEDRGRWRLSADWADEQPLRPYQVGQRKGGA